jgi:hypothetical protein
VITVRATPVALFVAVTVTPGRALPLASVARPVSTAPEVWANAAAGISTSSRPTKIRRNMGVLLRF